MSYEELVKQIKEVAEKSDAVVEINRKYDYIAVDFPNGDAYFFQDDSVAALEEEYKNSGVADDVSLEDYLKYTSIDW